jgi:hypothetical protein
MLDFAKSVTDGAWTLLIGWVFPSALNVLLFALVVLPSVEHVSPFTAVSGANANVATLAISAVTVGLILGALQTPLYRMLEGYNLWWRWQWIFETGKRRQVNVARRLRLINLLANAEESGPRLADAREQTARVLWRNRHPNVTDEPDAATLAQIQSTDREYGRIVREASGLGVLKRGLLQERLQRYPTHYEQFLPTQFGNAIRRLERFGPERFRLDQQVLWYELMAAAPEEVAKGVNQARSSTDFFVCLLFGNLVVAGSATVAAAFYPSDGVRLLTGATTGVALAFVWYRAAIASTDNWTAAVRSLINLGRKPLAERMGLKLPATIGQEQAMWKLVADLVNAPYDDDVSAINQFRDAGSSTTGSASVEAQP